MIKQQKIALCTISIISFIWFFVGLINNLYDLIYNQEYEVIYEHSIIFIITGIIPTILFAVLSFGSLYFAIKVYKEYK